MDSQYVSNTREAMNATTHKFLAELVPKLEKVFDKEQSLFYLASMNENLELFYKDVFTELENKQNQISEAIEGLLIEAEDLKCKLNVDFEFDLKHNGKIPLTVYRDKLDSDLIEMRNKYDQKINQIEVCMKTQQQLCEELGESLRELSVDPLASDSEIYEFENYLLDLKSEKVRRRNEIEYLQGEIHELCHELGVNVTDSVQSIPMLSREYIKYLQGERDRYQKEKIEVKNECEQLLQKLEILWDCLETPNSIRSKYREIAAKSKTSSITELNCELKLCKTAKQENIKHFIEKLRSKLIEQWDKIYKSQAERDKFEFLRNDTYTEDLLALHEMELEECTQFYNENKYDT